MKCKLIEHENMFEVAFEPETMEEAATLVRFGMNHTRELLRGGTAVYSDKTFHAYVQIGKAKRSAAQVSRGKW